MTTTMNIIQDLVYASYRFNRLRSPDISVSDWDKLFDTEILEPRFQEELNKDVTK